MPGPEHTRIPYTAFLPEPHAGPPAAVNARKALMLRLSCASVAALAALMCAFAAGVSCGRSSAGITEWGVWWATLSSKPTGTEEGGRQMALGGSDGVASEDVSDLMHVNATFASNYELAVVLFLRHGEKPNKGDGLSEEGERRAAYIARCMSSDGPSLALPFGKPTHLIATAVSKRSKRPIDTLKPLSHALNIKLNQDLSESQTDKFSKEVQKLRDRQTLVAAWHHGAIPDLVKSLLGKHTWHQEWPLAWPKKCDPPNGWVEPKHLDGSRCYDLMWRLTLKRDAGSSQPWKVLGLMATMQGFGGETDSPCHWGLERLGSEYVYV